MHACESVRALPVPLKYWQTRSRTLFSLEPGVTISSSRTHKRPLGSPSAARTLEIPAHEILNSSSPATRRYNCIFIFHVSAKEATNQTLKKIFHLNDNILSGTKNKYEIIVDILSLFFPLPELLTALGRITDDNFHDYSRVIMQVLPGD